MLYRHMSISDHNIKFAETSNLVQVSESTGGRHGGRHGGGLEMQAGPESLSGKETQLGSALL